MEKWKQEIDKWINGEWTADQQQDFEWYETVYNSFSNTFIDNNEEWIIEEDGVCNEWLIQLHAYGREPVYSAMVIERAFRLYISSRPNRQ